jgi:hypothetical protein
MKRKHYLLGSSLIALVFLLTSCASSVKSYSKPDLSIEKGRLGILPFSSNIPEVGNVVSDTIGANLLASGFDIVDRTHIIGDVTNVRFVLLGNIAFSSATARVVDASTGETLIIAIFQPSKIIGTASAVDIGNSLAKSLGKKLTRSTELQ